MAFIAALDADYSGAFGCDQVYPNDPGPLESAYPLQALRRTIHTRQCVKVIAPSKWVLPS